MKTKLLSLLGLAQKAGKVKSGEFSTESTQYGKQEVTVKPIEGANLADQLHEAVSHIQGSITEVELSDSELDEDADTSIPADPSVKNFSFTKVNGRVYYRENSRMNLDVHSPIT